MGLLDGKRVLVTGVLTKDSLAFAVADLAQREGAELVLTGAGRGLSLTTRTARKLSGDLDVLEFDVTDDSHAGAVGAALAEKWDRIDGALHAIAFAPREAMEGRYIDTRRQDWLLALEVSAYSLVAAAQRAEPLLREGGGIVTLTYYASEKVVPKYNVMAIAKAALEASVRYLAYELGPKGVRVNAISAGPVRTVAARSIPGFTKMYDRVAQTAPLRRNVTQEEVGNLGLFLLSPLASGITGEVVYVDAGYHIMGMELEG